MPISVSDARSNFNDQIAHAANVLRRSERLRAVFVAICRGGKRPKTVCQLMKITGYSHVVVLQMGGKLADQQLVHKIRPNGKTLYGKDRFYAANRAKILRLATNPNKLRKFPTKYLDVVSSGSATIKLIGARIQITEITCDDCDQFKNVVNVKIAPARRLSEKAFKAGVQRIIGEPGTFHDWGGEKNDLFTSKFRLDSKRRTVAFAFKGPGTKGELTPKKLGKNGDQIQRLFESPAHIFIVQYWGRINASVLDQMKEFAKAKSVGDGNRIWYGVIDGEDTNRLLAAYPREFGFK